MVDHISDINLTYSQIARDYLLREGIPPDQVICVGSPMREVLMHHDQKIKSSDIMKRLNLNPKKYFLISAHREENVDNKSRLLKLVCILNYLADTYGLPVIVSTHPRTQGALRKYNFKINSLVEFMKPFGFFDYINLQLNSRLVLSDSGTITEESSILGFSALNLRDVQERPEGFEEASVMLTGLELNTVKQCINVLENEDHHRNIPTKIVEDYKPLNVSSKVVRILFSLTSFVNRKVWHISDA